MKLIRPPDLWIPRTTCELNLTRGRLTNNHLLVGAAGGVPSAAAAGYSAVSVKFDGSNDWLDGIAGPTNSTTVTLSCWVNLLGGNSSEQTFFKDVDGRVQCIRTSANKIRFIVSDTSNNKEWQWDSTNDYTTTDDWIHLYFNYNNGTVSGIVTPVGNDAGQDSGGDTIGPTADTIDTDGSEIAVGAATNGNNKFNGDMADFVFDTSNISRASFIDGSAKPVDPSSLTSAHVLLTGGTTANWHENDGAGGNFTENGALTDGTDSPSD